ncbi:hypothetical protein LCGC14_2109680 [marine sediment metagenome]|uniref:HTH cro/C1-type domain-containing protein n=1 Tax=marine sediment metagenome TaxID=412755 RepID=A0A0F9EUK8_9ZZZZ
MMPMNPLQRAIDEKGWRSLSAALEVSHQAIRKWVEAERLPRSEFSGETNYAEIIERETDGAVSANDLLEWSRSGWNTQAA